MNKIVNCDLEKFRDAVEAIWLRGKYKSSTVSKVGVISNTAVGIIKDTRLELLNGNDKSAISVTIDIVGEPQEEYMFIFDIEKIMKYLKNLKSGDLKIKIDDANITFSMDRTSIKVPVLVEHSNMGLISMVRGLSIKTDKPVVFGKTPLPCMLMVNGEELASAIKFCNLVGTASFKINYVAGQREITISSSNFHRTEFVDRTIALAGNPSSEDLTVEFSAPIDKFCVKNVMALWSGDNKPIVITGPNRKMVIAPYIRSE